MKHKDNILKLRNKGKSYKQIQQEIGCSLGTISYHCGDGQKLKSLKRQRTRSSSLLAILKRKKDNFSFVSGNRRSAGKRKSMDFSASQFYDKLVGNPVCYLTGRPIDLLSPKTYNCDHIIPVSKGGGCTFNNLGLACRNANMSKSDMTEDEYVQLCKEVLILRGYKIILESKSVRARNMS
jgi:hypothetical protein